MTRELRSPTARRAVPLARFAASAGLAGLLTGGLWSLLPRSLDVHTDVVGYPIFANFNVNRYLWTYWLIALFFPLATLAIDLGLARVTRRFGTWTWPKLGSDRAVPEPSGTLRSAAVGLFRTAFVGGVLALEAAVASTRTEDRFVAAGLPTFALYCAVALAAAALAGPVVRRGWSLWDRLGAVNALLAPLTVLSLYGVSGATEVRAADGTVYEYDWLPLWLAAGLAAVLVSVAAIALRRARDGERVRALERRLLLLVAAPALLFLFTSSLPGERGPIDLFHEGEPLAAARLTENGAFPWRDLVVIHGLIHDVFQPLVGFTVLEDTRWGYVAGTALLLSPLYWLLQYFLFAYLFRDNVLFLAGTQVLVALGVIRDVHIRFVLMPLVLLLLVALLRTPTAPRAVGLAVLLLAQSVLSPETTYAIPACLLLLGLYELTSRRSGEPLLHSFRRTAWTIGAGAAATAVWLAVLAGFGALDDFFLFYRTFAPDHQLTGGIPLTWLDDRFRFAGIAPVVAVVLAIWYLTASVRSRRPASADDWAMGALAVVVLLYYPKFLSRADAHVYQVLAVAIPLIAYELYRLVSFVEAPLRRLRIRPVTIAALAAVVLVPTTSLVDVVKAIPARFEPRVSGARLDGLGFSGPGSLDLTMVEDVRRVLDEYLEPGDSVFDFSNNPGLFHYLLERRPSTRYYHVSMAIREHTQEDLVDRLADRPPGLVVFSTQTYSGLPSWDGISNQVRHYDVSDYLLDRYRPVVLSHGFLFLAPNRAQPPSQTLVSTLAEPPTTDNLYYRTLPCDWGYAPDFLAVGPEEDAPALSVPFRRLPATMTFAGWAVDLDAKAPARLVVAALGRRVIARTAPTGERADVAVALDHPGFTRSAFALSLDISWRRRLQDVRVYALTRDGFATEVAYGAGAAWMPTGPAPRTLSVDGKTVRIVPQKGHGTIDVTVGSADQTLLLDVPPRAARRGYDWLELRARAPLHLNEFGLTEDRGDLARRITFKTLGGGTTIRVRVGSCSQWHGYARRKLFLEASKAEAIEAVRLVRSPSN